MPVGQFSQTRQQGGKIGAQNRAAGGRYNMAGAPFQKAGGNTRGKALQVKNGPPPTVARRDMRGMAGGRGNAGAVQKAVEL